MQAAQDRYSSDATDGLNRPAHRRVLAQREMRANVIVVSGISRKDPAEMRHAEHHHMIEAFASGMSRFLLNIAKRPLPRLTLRGVGLASKDAVG